MHSQFFKDNQYRPYNPTYVSKNIVSTMMFPTSRQQLLHDYHQSQNVQPQPPTQKAEWNPQLGVNVAERDLRYRRVKSNLSGYGSNSLGNLFKISDKEIYENQQKKYNIVTMNPKPYNQSIKMFPKLRNQVKEDESRKVRQAFLRGQPEKAMERVKCMKNAD